MTRTKDNINTLEITCKYEAGLNLLKINSISELYSKVHKLKFVIVRDSQNEIDNSQYTAHNIIDWVNINISDTSKPRPNLKTIEFLAQKSKDDESIHIPIDNILSEWNSLFNIDHIRNMGVKVIANNCTLSNLNILNILKSQSNYF